MKPLSSMKASTIKKRRRNKKPLTTTQYLNIPQSTHSGTITRWVNSHYNFTMNRLLFTHFNQNHFNADCLFYSSHLYECLLLLQPILKPFVIPLHCIAATIYTVTLYRWPYNRTHSCRTQIKKRRRIQHGKRTHTIPVPLIVAIASGLKEMVDHKEILTKKRWNKLNYLINYNFYLEWLGATIECVFIFYYVHYYQVEENERENFNKSLLRQLHLFGSGIFSSPSLCCLSKFFSFNLVFVFFFVGCLEEKTSSV